MQSRTNLHSIIVDFLQSQLPEDPSQQEQLARAIGILRKVWNISNEDITNSKDEYGALIDRIQYFDNMIPNVRQLIYMSSEDLKFNEVHSSIFKIGLAKQYNLIYDPSLLCNSAAILYKCGMYQYSALESLNALDIDPEYLKAYIRLGLACWALNKPQLAMIAYKKGLEISPGNPIILHNIEVLNNKKAKPPKPTATLKEQPALSITMLTQYIIDGVDFVQELGLTYSNLPGSTLPSTWTPAEFAEKLNSPEMQELMSEVDIEELRDLLNKTSYTEDEKMKKILSTMLKLP